MSKVLVRFLKDENGAAAVEYGLLVAAIAAIIIITVFTLGGYVESAFQTTCNAFGSASSPSLSNLTGGTC